jgi:hypothetical protein
MPIQKMTKKDFEAPVAGHAEYIEYLTSARVGEGGRLLVDEEGVSRQSIKNRLNIASKVTGKNIKFYRSAASEVVFQVVE